MHHVAVMKKSWGFLEKIARGEKTIESRWYQTKRIPWGRVAAGDVIYFKNSGNPIVFTATVAKVLQFADINPQKVKAILAKYGKQDGIKRAEFPKFYRLFKNKRYCILIFLRTLERVTPFHIDKTGFGAMSAWVSIEDIRSIKV